MLEKIVFIKYFKSNKFDAHKMYLIEYRIPSLLPYVLTTVQFDLVRYIGFINIIIFDIHSENPRLIIKQIFLNV